MLKTALFKLFISRAAPVAVQYAGKLIQNGAVAVTALLAKHGFVAGDNVTMIAAGLVGLVAVGVDFARTHIGQ